MTEQNILLAFILTAIAGLSTGIGSLIALIAKHTNIKFLCASLGFSAGIMLYVSFMEMMPQGKEELVAVFGEKLGTLYLILAFFAGIAFINLIDFLIPESLNPHEIHGVEEMDKKKSLKRTGIVVAMSIAIHKLSGRNCHFYLCIGISRCGNTYYHSYRHTQYTRRNCGCSAYLSCNGQPQKGILVFLCFGTS